MFRKIAFTAALAGMIALFCCGCSKKAGTTFTVGFDASFPPYGFIGADGNYTGFDLDLAQEVCNRLGWELVKKPVDWPAKDAELNAGTIDCIWNGFTITDERKTQYTWSEPYVQNNQLLLVRADSGIKSLADLNGKAVVVQDGSSGASAMEEAVSKAQQANPAFALREYKKVPDYNTAYVMLDSKAVDAIGLDSAVAKGFVDKSAGKFVILDEPLAAEMFGIGFKLGNEALRDQVQTVLKEMVKDGTCAKILEKWHANTKDGGDGIDFILQP